MIQIKMFDEKEKKLIELEADVSFYYRIQFNPENLYLKFENTELKILQYVKTNMVFKYKEKTLKFNNIDCFYIFDNNEIVMVIRDPLDTRSHPYILKDDYDDYKLIQK